MAKYLRIRTTVEVSDATDYSRAEVYELSDTYTPDERMKYLVEAAITTGDDISTGSFASIDAMVVENKDTTNFVTLTYVSLSGGGTPTSQPIKILAGEHVVLVDVDPSTDPNITADTAACICMVDIWGS